MIHNLESWDLKARVLQNSVLLDRGAPAAFRLGHKDWKLILPIVEQTRVWYYTVILFLVLNTTILDMADLMDKRTGRVNKP